MELILMKEEKLIARVRRKREFTNPEKFPNHPIMKLLDNETVQKIQKLRNQEGLRFKDFQILLCDEQPSEKNPTDCQKKEDCQECPRFKRCEQADLIVWAEAFRGLEMPKKVYGGKSHLSEDLHRLFDADLLGRGEGGTYIKASIKSPKHKALLKRAMLRDCVKTCPPDMIQMRGDDCFLFLRKEAFEGNDEKDREFWESVEKVRAGLLVLAARNALTKSSKDFKKQVVHLEGAEEKIHLQRYLLDHISTRLASLGLDESMFAEELSPICDFDLGFSEETIREINAKLKQANDVILEAKRKSSNALWTMRLTDSPADAFAQLTMEFVFDLEPDLFESLMEGQIKRKLTAAFTSHQQPLSTSAKAARIRANTWLISDDENHYLIEKSGNEVHVAKKKQGEKMDMPAILETWQHLRSEEAFSLWFSQSRMHIPLKLREESPMVIIDSISTGP